MLPGAHIIVANAISLNLTKTPIGGFILGVITHHIFDALPHIDLNILKNYNEVSIRQLPKNIKILLAIEGLTGVVFSLIYFIGMYNKDFLLFLFISAGAIFPDLISILFKKAFEKYGFFKKYMNFHSKFHFAFKNQEIKTIILVGAVELILIVVSLIFFNLSEIIGRI